MTSADPTTLDTIDADGANKIAAEDQDVTGGYRPMSGESDAANSDSTTDDAAPLGDGGIAGETERPGD